MPVAEKFFELQQLGKTPVCLFPSRKQCDELNQQIVEKLSTRVQEIPCNNEIDETSSTRKWNKKAAEHLQKLNQDCNKTDTCSGCMCHVTVDSGHCSWSRQWCLLKNFPGMLSLLSLITCQQHYNYEQVKSHLCV